MRPSDDLDVSRSERDTANAFQRTRMSTDRTLMSAVRTSLSLISFGFTIFQFFRALLTIQGAQALVRSDAPRRFGLTLVFLGVCLLAAAIWQHVTFMHELNAERRAVLGDAFAKGERFPFSVALGSAVVLLLVGLVAIASMALRAGPFH